jgi:hypothetical protein
MDEGEPGGIVAFRGTRRTGTGCAAGAVSDIDGNAVEQSAIRAYRFDPI